MLLKTFIAFILFSLNSHGIVNGKKANTEELYEFESVAYIKINKDRGYDTYLGECTGVLISPNLVLTAAHCFLKTKTSKAQATPYHIDQSGQCIPGQKITVTQSIVELPIQLEEDISVRVKYKKKKKKKNGYKLKSKTRKVKKVILHPRIYSHYQTGLIKSYFPFDLALLELKEPINISRYPLIQTDLDYGQYNINIAGYGFTKLEDKINNSDRLYFARRTTSYNPFSEMIEYFVTPESPQVYKADSGSALFTDKMEIIGITQSVTRKIKCERRNSFVNLNSNYSTEFFNHLNSLGYSVNY